MVRAEWVQGAARSGRSEPFRSRQKDSLPVAAPSRYADGQRAATRGPSRSRGRAPARRVLVHSDCRKIGIRLGVIRRYAASATKLSKGNSLTTVRFVQRGLESPGSRAPQNFKSAPTRERAGGNRVLLSQRYCCVFTPETTRFDGVRPATLINGCAMVPLGRKSPTNDVAGVPMKNSCSRQPVSRGAGCLC